MALPKSGRLSFSDIAKEFDPDYSPNKTYRFSEFYAGGKYVPAGTLNGKGEPIPSYGPLSFSDFYGAAMPTPDPDS